MARERSALERWVELMVGVIISPVDVSTLGQWARVTATSSSTIRSICTICQVSGRRSKDLARITRVVALSQRTEWQPYAHLAISDERTLRKLLRSAHLLDAGLSVPTVSEFLNRQELMSPTAPTVRALRARLISAETSSLAALSAAAPVDIHVAAERQRRSRGDVGAAG